MSENRNDGTGAVAAIMIAGVVLVIAAPYLVALLGVSYGVHKYTQHKRNKNNEQERFD